MKLSTTTYDTYWERGWAVVEGVFTTEEIDRIAVLATQICDEELLELSDQPYFADRTTEGQVIPRKLDFPFLKHAHFRLFAFNERLRSLIEQLIGKPPLLLQDQIFMKPPRFGSAKPYHQDNAYFLLHPDDEALTAWIALDDVDELNGCLRYIDGSHRGPIFEHLPLPDEPYNLSPAQENIDLNREALAPVGKGGVVFHHSKMLHTSHRNESDRWRRAYATHWVSAEVTSENETMDVAYYKANADIYEAATQALTTK